MVGIFFHLTRDWTTYWRNCYWCFCHFTISKIKSALSLKPSSNCLQAFLLAIDAFWTTWSSYFLQVLLHRERSCTMFDDITSAEPLEGTLMPVIRATMAVERKPMVPARCFGQYGVLAGQFTEPCSIVGTPNNTIAVTDTPNHRIQVCLRYKHKSSIGINNFFRSTAPMDNSCFNLESKASMTAKFFTLIGALLWWI